MNEHSARILVVDDEVNIREALGALLESDGYETAAAASIQEAMDLIHENYYDLVISDLRMKDGSGLELISHLREISPATEIIILTAYGTVEGAVEAMKLGAYDYLSKPVDRKRLGLLMEKALEKQRLYNENRNLRRRLSIKEEFSSIIGSSAKIRSVFKIITEVATTNATVLITGESGTGKELVARALHNRSNRRGKSFVTLNCGALPDTLMESELFGYEKGAFTGAMTMKRGRIEMASQGTLFLDEVGDMSAKTQVDFLRILQDRELHRLGGSKAIAVDVRFIAATNRDLKAGTVEHWFREDLYYRFNVVPIAMPPLRERRDDIPLLLEAFLSELCSIYNKPPKRVSEKALEMLVRYHWPGNIRELRNLVERLVLLCRGDRINPENLPPQISRVAGEDEMKITVRLDKPLRETEEAVIRGVLARVDNNRTTAARMLGISLRALHYKIQRYGLNDN
ncbi:MAG TPA: sigma-54 dependent transcriptional regulator [Acidobacteriota bacterium]|nr:sigma-54 dependent transcriptional regulator [Acidobacteriota bacterium]